MFPLSEIVYVLTCADDNAKYEKPNVNIICRRRRRRRCAIAGRFVLHCFRHMWSVTNDGLTRVAIGIDRMRARCVSVRMNECHGFTKTTYLTG